MVTLWRSRGYLPHFEQEGLIQSITFRLADSLPAEMVAELRELRERLPMRAFSERYHAYLDAGYGACELRDPRVARMVEEALLYFDGVRYNLAAWVVMPNHVHALIEMMRIDGDFALASILHSWKSFSAKETNRILGREGVLWEREYFDRFIRTEQHFRRTVDYIHFNPVVAGLVDTPEAWPFSSARFVAGRY